MPKSSGGLEHEQMSLFGPYLVAGALERKRDLEAEAVWRTGSAVVARRPSWRFNVLH